MPRGEGIVEIGALDGDRQDADVIVRVCRNGDSFATETFGCFVNCKCLARRGSGVI